MSQYWNMTTKSFLPECGREEKGADKCLLRLLRSCKW
nr:MAG TPA: CRAL/TRIO, N-terminal domain [Caudoviricetes sp.]